jgi:hypothetical protein
MRNSGRCIISDVSFVLPASHDSILMLLLGAAAFLSHLLQITESDSQELETESAVYRLLLYVPTEYLTKAARVHLVQKAYLADLQLVRSMSKGKNSHQTSAVGNLVTMRVFLKRVIGLVGLERIPVSGSTICFLELYQIYSNIQAVDLGDFIVHLISFNPADGSEHKRFTSSTLDLIELCFR